MLFESGLTSNEHNKLGCSMFNWAVIFSIWIAELVFSTLSCISHMSYQVYFCCNRNVGSLIVIWKNLPHHSVM